MNEQLGAELFASHLYLSMSAYCDSVNLPGFAHWFRVQAAEERGHAMRFFDHLNDRGARVRLGAIPAPDEDFDGPIGVFERALAHERAVTASIDTLVRSAVEQDDYASQVFLQWFVQEQVEEEKQAEDVLRMVVRASEGEGSGLFILDRELAQRAD
jgi:ferritin